MKTLEQVLSVRGLTAAQKERAKEWAKAQERFGKPTEFDVETDQQVKDRLNQLQLNYEKRKAREAKTKEAKDAIKAEVEALTKVVNDAKKYNVSLEEIIGIINAGIKEKKNAALLAQIAELQAQLEE